MLNSASAGNLNCSLLAQAVQPPSARAVVDDLWVLRPRTTALLRRYARLSIEVGRLPSLLGKGDFRARLTLHSGKTFEDAVIFVADMDCVLDTLSEIDRRLLAMNVLEDYTVSEIARLLHCSERSVERELYTALDTLSWGLRQVGML
jgi:DNA-directed RNA polymerase specialized sigma24 family protein